LRDASLNRAIDAAGGIAQLARKIGIAQPSVSNWSRVPAERVIAVEAATGVSRKQLRPDLYTELAVPHDGVDPVDAGRAQEYALLGALLSYAPSNALLSQIARLRDDATPLGRAHAALADAVSIAVAGEVEREYFDLFVGLARGELLPYASYYLTGFLNERPLSRLRDDLAALGIERPRTTSSRRITRRRCARSWLALPLAASLRRRKRSAPSREACGLVDGAHVRRYGAGNARQVLQTGRLARPPVSGNRG